jgi:hypothetical protein
MSAGKGRKNLLQQVDRLPLDPALREEILTGVEGLSEGRASRHADQLKAALDSLPELAGKLRTASAKDRTSSSVSRVRQKKPA